MPNVCIDKWTNEIWIWKHTWNYENVFIFQSWTSFIPIQVKWSEIQNMSIFELLAQSIQIDFNRFIWQVLWVNGTQSEMLISIRMGTKFDLSICKNWKLISLRLSYSLDPLPPGCLSINCAHARAPEFYAESVYPGYENNFQGIKCGSLSALNGKFCPGRNFSMGYAVQKNLKGNYFLKTRDKSPFGENAPANFTPPCVKQTTDDNNNATTPVPVPVSSSSSKANSSSEVSDKTDQS